MAWFSAESEEFERDLGEMVTDSFSGEEGRLLTSKTSH